jgi:hypothetical protein
MLPFPSVTIRMIRGETRTPPLASVPYAVVISSAVTSCAPSASDGNGRKTRSNPERSATRATSGRPVACAARIVGTLSDFSSASRAVTIPRNSPS